MGSYGIISILVLLWASMGDGAPTSMSDADILLEIMSWDTDYREYNTSIEQTTAASSHGNGKMAVGETKMVKLSGRSIDAVASHNPAAIVLTELCDDALSQNSTTSTPSDFEKRVANDVYFMIEFWADFCLLMIMAYFVIILIVRIHARLRVREYETHIVGRTYVAPRTVNNSDVYVNIPSTPPPSYEECLAALGGTK